MTTVIVRINSDRHDGLRGTVELPGGESRVFTSDDDLLDTLYDWSLPAEKPEPRRPPSGHPTGERP